MSNSVVKAQEVITPATPAHLSTNGTKHSMRKFFFGRPTPELSGKDQNVNGMAPAAPDGVACQACRRVRIFCDKRHPCSRCVRLNMECVPQTRGRGRPSFASLTGGPDEGMSDGGNSNSAHSTRRRGKGKKRPLEASLSPGGPGLRQFLGLPVPPPPPPLPAFLGSIRAPTGVGGIGFGPYGHLADTKKVDRAPRRGEGRPWGKPPGGLGRGESSSEGDVEGQEARGPEPHSYMRPRPESTRSRRRMPRPPPGSRDETQHSDSSVTLDDTLAEEEEWSEDEGEGQAMASVSFEMCCRALVLLRAEDKLDQDKLDFFCAHASYFRVGSHAAAREMLRVMSDPHANRRKGEQGPTSRPAPPPPALLFATRADQADLFHKLNMAWADEIFNTPKAYTLRYLFTATACEVTCGERMQREVMNRDEMLHNVERFASTVSHAIAWCLARESLFPFHSALWASVFGRNLLNENHCVAKLVKRNQESVRCLASVRSVCEGGPCARLVTVRFWPLHDMTNFRDAATQNRWVEL